MSDSDALSAFVRDALSTYEADVDDGDDGDDAGPAGGSDDGFWDSLSPEDQDAITEGDADLLERRTAEYAAAEGRYAGDDEAGDDDDEEDLASSFASRGEFVAWALNRPDEFEAWAGMPRDEWVQRWSEASPEEWHRECERSGWPVELTLTHNDIPFGPSWAADMARRQALIAAGDKRGYFE